MAKRKKSDIMRYYRLMYVFAVHQWCNSAFINRNKRKYACAIITVLLLWFCLSAIWSSSHSSLVLPHTPSVIVDTVDARTLESHIQYLSDDLLEGRGVGTRGEQLAVLYLETEMKQAGLVTHRQSVPMVGMATNLPQTEEDLEEPRDPNQQTKLSFASKTRTDQKLEAIYKDELVISSDVVSERVTLQPGDEVVFVGYGINAPEYGWNDYKFGKVQGKILIMFVNEPHDKDNQKYFKGDRLTYYGRWMYKYEEARRQGAKGVILIHTNPTASYPFSVLANQAEQVQLLTHDGAAAGTSSGKLQIKGWISEPVARKLAQMCSSSLEAWFKLANQGSLEPVPLPVTVAAQMHFKLRHFSGVNLIGLLKGSVLPDEHIVVTSHHDHLGMGPPDEEGDTIYNGAEDNASGSAMMLAMITALTLKNVAKPQRSIVFVSLTAEEPGLFGALYYTMHPVVGSTSSLIANINIDIGNVYGKTRDIVGLGAEDSDLGPLFSQAASSEGLYVSEDPNPASGSFLRSDAFAFVKAGIPSVYVWTGKDFVNQPADYFKRRRDDYVNNRYHHPNDEYTPDPDKWNFDGLIQQTRVCLKLINGLANSNIVPQMHLE